MHTAVVTRALAKFRSFTISSTKRSAIAFRETILSFWRPAWITWVPLSPFVWRKTTNSTCNPQVGRYLINANWKQSMKNSNIIRNSIVIKTSISTMSNQLELTLTRFIGFNERIVKAVWTPVLYSNPDLNFISHYRSHFMFHRRIFLT